MNEKTLTAEQCSKLSLYILMTTKTREGEAATWEKLAEEKKEKVEIEYLFDFYKRLWEKEKDAFLAAYIQKHRIFAIRADVEPREMSLEESIKMSALMRGMSDESPLRAIEAGK